MIDFFNRSSEGFFARFLAFAKKFLEKGVFFFASFLLDEQKKPIGSRTPIYKIENSELNEGQVKTTLVHSENNQKVKAKQRGYFLCFSREVLINRGIRRIFSGISKSFE